MMKLWCCDGVVMMCWACGCSTRWLLVGMWNAAESRDEAVNHGGTCAIGAVVLCKSLMASLLPYAAYMS